MMRRRSSVLYRVQRSISATLRPQPMQSPERGSMAQT